MATVKLTNVKKIYGKNTVAVQDFNLDIADKEFIVFVGPSGCGKSTTLRMIAGLEEISDGTIEIDGKVVNDLQPKDRDIAMVFQNYALYPHLTVFENMAFALRLKRIPETELYPKQEAEQQDEASDNATEQHTDTTATEATAQEDANAIELNVDAGAVKASVTVKKPKQPNPNKLVKIPEEEIYKRVTEAAEILGITDYLMRRPRELSGGQRQRVAIGRAMVRDSKVFLMDEPLSNLDAKLRNQMRAEIILLRKKIDTTFIYVTHDQTEAMTLGDRIVIMKDGFVQQVGTPTEVFEMPSNLFVAEFIGAPKMNTFTTELMKDKQGYYVMPFGAKIRVDGDKGDMLKSNGVEPQQIVLGVRPEHVTLTTKTNPSAIPCTIRVTEMMGSELHLHVSTESGEQLIVRVPTVQLTAQQVASLVAGARIYVTFHSKVMHFFDVEHNLNLLVQQPSLTEQTDSEEQAASQEKTAS